MNILLNEAAQSDENPDVIMVDDNKVVLLSDNYAERPSVVPLRMDRSHVIHKGYCAFRS